MKVFLITYFFGVILTAGINYNQHCRIFLLQNLTQNWGHDQVLLPPTPYSQREFRIAHLRLIPKPDAIIFGSSRATRIKADTSIVPRNTYNASLDAASIEDFVALWQALKDLHRAPQKIYLFLDPWVFKQGNSLRGWEDNWELYERFIQQYRFASRFWLFEYLRCKTLYRMNYVIHDFTDHLSWRMTADSLNLKKSAEKKINVAFQIINRADFHTKGIAFAADGSLIPDDPGYNPVADYFLHDWKLDTFKIELLQKLTEDMESHGVDLMLIAAPFHPRTMASNQNTRVWTDFRYALEKFGHRTCIRLDSTEIGCRESDFYDDTHFNNDCMKKVLVSCLSQ